MNLIDKIVDTIEKFDTKKNNPDVSLIKSNVAAAIYSNKPLVLVNFTCSTINPKNLLNQTRPELYISLNTKGNNLQEDLPKLNLFYLKLSQLYPVKLLILIGNTDPYYIYSEQGSIYPKIKKTDLLNRYNSRWKKYRRNLEEYINKSFPKLQLRCEVISWYEVELKGREIGLNFSDGFDKTWRNINGYFSQDDFSWELLKLKKAFGPDKYFYNLKRPPIPTLRRWIKRKFAEYALQGLWIKFLYPNAILLQNEKPSDLRYKMYQPLIEKYLNTRLPNIYPYGVDNNRYQ